MTRPPPRPTLFPYTTLFRSLGVRPPSATRISLMPAAWSRCACSVTAASERSEEQTSELQSQSNLVCRLLLEKKNMKRGRAAVEKIQQCSRKIFEAPVAQRPH